MIINKSELNKYFWERRDEIFDDLAKYGFEQRDLGASGIRIQPCICGHFDCCTAREVDGIPKVHCFSCGISYYFDNYTIKCYKEKNVDPISHLEKFLNIKISFTRKVDEYEDRIAEIRGKAADFYHRQLIITDKALQYENIIRQISKDTLEIFKVGYTTCKHELRQSLLENKYTVSEIDEAKVLKIPDNVIVFPYLIDNKVVRFNIKNAFDIDCPGFSTGEKSFYTIPNFRYGDEVIVVEGEHDAMTSYQHGIYAVATGGNPSKEQTIKYLSRFKKVYLMMDNDDAGIHHIEKINSWLPDIKVYQIIYDKIFSDPDELFRKSDTPLSIEELKTNSIELKNENFKTEFINNAIYLKNRNYELEYIIKDIDGKGNFKGDFFFKRNGVHEDIKFNITLDKIPRAYKEFILPIRDAIGMRYNADLDKKDIAELMENLKFTNRKLDTIKIVAKKISELEENEKDIKLTYIENNFNYYYDGILKEINSFENQILDDDVSLPTMPASQAFNLKNNKAYMYFNSVQKDNEGFKVIPSLLCSDKRVIRLDLFRRKTEQHLLIVDNAFTLQQEVPTSIMSTDICSLKSKYAKKYISNEINKEDVFPSTILKEMEDYFEKVLYIDDPLIYKILALFSYSTYFYQLFGITPYLFLNAEKGSGKSLVSYVLSKLCFCARYTVGVTEASLFRAISLGGHTIILDEMESLTSRDRTQDSLMASILKSGYTREGGNTMRTNLETKSIEEFSLFGPKIISNIYGMEDVIEDRCIKINLKKYDPEKLANKFNIEVFKELYIEAIEETTSRAAISSLCYFQEMFESFTNTNLVIGSARNSQILRPLFAIAKVAGNGYSEALHTFYEVYMCKDKKWVEENSPEGMLKRAVNIVAKEVYFNEFDWLDSEFYKQHCRRIDDKTFRTNSFIIKLLLEELDGSKPYSMNETHKLIKRVFQSLEFKHRTSISIKSDNNLVIRMKNQEKVSVYPLEFNFQDYIENFEIKSKRKKFHDEIF